MDYQELGHYERTRPNKYGEDLLPLRGRFRNMSPDDGSSSDSGDGRLFRRRARSISPYYHSRNQEDSDDEGGAGRDHVVANSIHKNYSAGRLGAHDVSSSYISTLEKENAVLQQQLRNMNRPRVSLPAPRSGRPRPRPRLDPIDDVEEIVSTPSGFNTRDTRSKVELGPSLAVSRIMKQFPNCGPPQILVDTEGWQRPNNFSNRQLITVIREVDSINRHRYTWIQVFSPVLTRLLKALPNIAGLQNPVDDVLEINEPFVELFHNRRDLHDAAKSEHLEGFTNLDLLQVRRHIRFILDFINFEFRDISHKLDDLESDRPLNTITYPEIWMLYKPGTVVYNLKDGEYEAFVVEEIRGLQKRRNPRNRSHSHTRLYVTCFSIDYDGEIFGRVWSQHCLSPFRGSKQISSLDLVPEKFLPDIAKIKTSLLNRGKAFWDLQGQRYCEYTGKMYSEHDDEETSRVMVDRLTYQRHNEWPISINRKQGPSEICNKNLMNNRVDRSRKDTPDQSQDIDEWDAPIHRWARTPLLPHDDAAEWAAEREGMEFDYYQTYQRCMIDRPALPELSKFETYDVLDPKDEPRELALLLSPQYVHGYCLRDEVWRKLNVNQLRPVTFRQSAWDSLVFDGENKDMVEAMVSSYVSKSANPTGLLTSKGQGLIALLHGPSGNGKTLAAECAAEAFSKPLIQITCADLCTNFNEFEAHLKEIFEYVKTWGAILVLDKADILLQDPGTTTLEQNALIGIFSRALDNFSGMLFLTADRVSSSDQAVQSRIHVSIPMPALDEKRRVQVWNIFLNDLAKNSAIEPGRQGPLKQLVREKWCKHTLSGRQIQSAIQMALVLAERKGTVLGEAEVDGVLRLGGKGERNGHQAKGEMGALEGFEEVDKP